jgi:hypothetical protein
MGGGEYYGGGKDRRGGAMILYRIQKAKHTHLIPSVARPGRAGGRVEPGSYLPGAPTDPDVPN